MNLLTPAKKTQISPDRQERLLQAASNEIADELGAGTWTNRYFREEDIARAEKSNPDLAERMKALNALWGESKKKASKRRKEKKAAQDAGQKESTNNPLLRALGR
jgi:flagellar motility protein MotE (MotC chaperone)